MIHIIANPLAQSGAIRPVIARLTSALEELSLPYDLHLTEYAGHAGVLASELPLASEDRLVLLGGDGSIDEVVGGLPLPAPCPVLLLPAGTGNDFARGLRLDRSFETLLDLLKTEAAPMEILDLGQAAFINSDGTTMKKNFAVSCGLGMDAAVCVVLRNSPIKTLCNRLHVGKLSYIIHGIQVLLATSHKKRTNLRLILDDDKMHTYTNTAFISIHNTPYEGGGFPFAPKASPSDGLLSVCIVTVPNRLLLIPVLLASLAGGKHTLFAPFVHMHTCSTLKMVSDRPLPFHTDGEVTEGIRKVTVRILPRVLPLIYRSPRD